MKLGNRETEFVKTALTCSNCFDCFVPHRIKVPPVADWQSLLGSATHHQRKPRSASLTFALPVLSCNAGLWPMRVGMCCRAGRGSASGCGAMRRVFIEFFRLSPFPSFVSHLAFPTLVTFTSKSTKPKSPRLRLLSEGIRLRLRYPKYRIIWLTTNYLIRSWSSRHFCNQMSRLSCW